MACRQGSFNQIFFALRGVLIVLGKCSSKRNRHKRAIRAVLEPGAVHRKSVAVAQDYGTLDHILQLANVSRQW